MSGALDKDALKAAHKALRAAWNRRAPSPDMREALEGE